MIVVIIQHYVGGLCASQRYHYNLAHKFVLCVFRICDARKPTTR